VTHTELVERAAKWLRNSTPSAVVITEMGSGAWEEPDAIGFGCWNAKVLHDPAGVSKT
jgi:hypothetical protein